MMNFFSLSETYLINSQWHKKPWSFPQSQAVKSRLHLQQFSIQIRDVLFIHSLLVTGLSYTAAFKRLQDWRQNQKSQSATFKMIHSVIKTCQTYRTFHMHMKWHLDTDSMSDTSSTNMYFSSLNIIQRNTFLTKCNLFFKLHFTMPLL